MIIENVTKAGGNLQNYSEAKVRNSIGRAGIASVFQEKVMCHIEENLFEGIPTSKIADLIAESLREIYPSGERRYQLKRAIMELGPTGFPFEHFVARLLRMHGYTTDIDVIMQGMCVKHEVDVLATKDTRQYFVECKYHNQRGSRTDVKTVLYVKARGDDIKEQLVQSSSTDNAIEYGPWIFTNTKFSLDALSYAQCKNIRLTGWGYPEKGNLQHMIEHKQLYPITCLSGISLEQRSMLLSNNYIFIDQLCENDEIMKKTGFTKQQMAHLNQECSLLNVH